MPPLPPPPAWEFYSWIWKPENREFNLRFSFLNYWFNGHHSPSYLTTVPHYPWLGVLISQVLTILLGVLATLSKHNRHRTFLTVGGNTVSWFALALCSYQFQSYLHSRAFRNLHLAQGFWIATASAILFTLSLLLVHPRG